MPPNTPKPVHSFIYFVPMLIIGTLLRYWLIFSQYQSTIGNRVEVSTPLNSWLRVSEGLYLQSKGIDPYQGDLLHEPPLMLYFYRQLINTGIPIELVFIFFDVATAIVIYYIAKAYMFYLYFHQEEIKIENADPREQFIMQGDELRDAPLYAASVFLFGPFTLFNCVGLSTMVFHNFFLALALLGILKASLWSIVFLVFCIMTSLYPFILLIPAVLSLMMYYKTRLVVLLVAFCFVANIVAWHGLCTLLADTSGYIKNVFGFIVTIPDLQPNIGLFWYFFTEVFEHFRALFLTSFQINVTFLYLIPFTLKFYRDPFLLSVSLLIVIAIFKTYPCLGDIGFIMSFLPCFSHLNRYYQQSFMVGVMLVITSAMGPIVWYLWIYSHSANANFYFGVTLAFAIAQIFYLTDLLFAYLKREFSLKYGTKREVNGKPALLLLE